MAQKIEICFTVIKYEHICKSQKISKNLSIPYLKATGIDKVHNYIYNCVNAMTEKSNFSRSIKENQCVVEL